MYEMILTLFLYAIPLGVILFFLVSLGLFIVALVRRKRDHGAVSKAAMAVYTTLLIVSATCLVMLVAVVVAMIALLYTAVAYM